MTLLTLPFTSTEILVSQQNVLTAPQPATILTPSEIPWLGSQVKRHVVAYQLKKTPTITSLVPTLLSIQIREPVLGAIHVPGLGTQQIQINGRVIQLCSAAKL